MDSPTPDGVWQPYCDGPKDARELDDNEYVLTPWGTWRRKGDGS